MTGPLIVPGGNTAEIAEYNGSNNLPHHAARRRQVVVNSEKEVLVVVDPVNGTRTEMMSATSPEIGGVAVTASAAELNVLDGLAVPQAELQTVDPSQKVTFFDDFLAAAIDARISSTAGSGTSNEAATTVADGLSGEITLKSASDDGAHGANGTTLTLDQLNFKANQGGLAMEARLKIDDVSEAALFVGFTDTISTTVELPLYMTAGAIDSDAADACGLIYDVDATVDRFTAGGVKAGTDTDPTIHATLAPEDDVYFTVRVEVSAAGAVSVYVDGTLIGTVADAVTATVAITPAIVIANRSANQVIATVDYLWVQQDR